MKYLVTGGAGFIGSNFIHYLFKTYLDVQVINLDKLTYAGNLDNLADIENNPNYKFIKGDIADPKTVQEAIQGVDVVVNFAAETHVDRSIMNPDVFVKTNIMGTYVLLEAALKNKVKRFHHVSTDEVFGSLELGSKEKFNEHTKYEPSSPYSASKAASDHLVNAYFKTFGLPITISNCSNNYGPYQYPEKFIPVVIINALGNKKIPVYGDGLNVRDWIHAEEHSSGVDLIIQKGSIGETYLLGVNGERTNLDVVKMILKILGKNDEQIEFVKDRPGHDRRYAIDSSKVMNELGFKQMYNFEDGLKQTIQWYQENQDWWKKLLGKEYTDYYKKQYGNNGV